MRKSLWRGLLAGVVGLLALVGVAQADTSSTLTIVGTSDVNDSGLIPNLIKPEFQAAYPQYTLNYLPSATGAAIQAAKATGTASSPSMLIVHAASLENQFVAGGYSQNNAYGNAIFRNDFVLAGPATNEASFANVASNGTNNVAQAFADIAASGVAGKSTFLSRGGDITASGTTVEEHAIWQYVYAAGLTPAGVVLCNVSNTTAQPDGGGMSPISPTVQATSGQACPDAGTVNSTDTPTWYVSNFVGQTKSLTNTSACTVGNGPANNGSGCYDLTDRGTFDYESQGGTTTAGPSAIPNLAIVSRDNAAGAPGGRYALINYFHAYILNPTGPNQPSGTSFVNTAAAQAFMSFVTSPTVQSQLKTYLANTGDPGGAPFVADASPIITAAGLPGLVQSGQSVTVGGNVANAEIGYPTLAGEPVQVDEVVGGQDVPVSGATGTTDGNGNYSISFTPPSTGSYQVVTSQITQIENPALSPIYGDILSPGASAAMTVTVQAPASVEPPVIAPVSPAPATPTPPSYGITLKSAKAGPGYVKVTGTLNAAPPDANASILILARKYGSKGAFVQIGGTTLKQGATTFASDGTLGAGKWEVEVRYADPGRFTAATSKSANVTLSADRTNAGLSKATVKSGKLTVTGKLSQAAPANATVELVGLQTAHTNGAKLAKPGHFVALAKVTVKAGKSTFTLSAKVPRGYRYSVQLEYVQKGKATTYSRLSTISVS